VTIKQMPVEQPAILGDELIERGAMTPAHVDCDQMNPRPCDRVVVAVLGSVDRGKMADGRGHPALCRLERVSIEVAPRELEMFRMTEATPALDDFVHGREITVVGRRRHQTIVARARASDPSEVLAAARMAAAGRVSRPKTS
jgi:hypothetical protein